MVNATALTLAKAETGKAISHDVKQETGTKITHIEVDNKMRMTKANSLGKHPSTITYGWTVTKMSKAEVDADNVKWMH